MPEAATPAAVTREDQKAAILKLAEQEYAAHTADAVERVKIQASIADRAMQSLMIANGGAMVALFTFAGNVAKVGTSPVHLDAVGLKRAFAAFVVGLAATLLAHLFAFVSQDRYYNVSMHEAVRAQATIAKGEQVTDQAAAQAAFATGQRAYIVGLGTFLVAVIAFVVGCGFALWSVV